MVQEREAGAQTADVLTDEDPAPGVRVELTDAELAQLTELARHYEKVMGFVRHVVVATSRMGVRRRYRHIVLESKGLEAIAIKMRERLRSAGGDVLETELALEEAVAIWGRALSSMRTKRSRRKLSSPQLALQESIERKFAEGVRSYSALRETAVRAAIATRRKR